MRNKFQIPLLLAVALTTTACLASDLTRDAGSNGHSPIERPRFTVELMTDWKHIRRDQSDAEQIDFDDREWSVVNLPHSFNASDGADGGGHYRGIAWYRKSIDIPSSLSAKQIWIQFEGVSFTADVYVDGVLVGPQHQGGFSTFNYDVTSHLTPGRHIIAIRVDNSRRLEKRMPPPAGDYTKAGGIYRDVRLIAVNAVHVALNETVAELNAGVATPGVYWTATSLSTETVKVLAKTSLDNQSDEPRIVEINALLIDHQGRVCMKQVATCNLPPRASGVVVDLDGSLMNPRLWNGRIDPYLYRAVIELRDHENGQLLDEVHQRLGLRSFSFDPQRGFILNGQPYPLNGVNAHQDERGKGWARSDKTIRRDIDFILEMGATVVRTSHYPANQAFYDYADETGLIVYTEIALNGTTSGGKVPNTEEFLHASRDQMRELIRQNYNHPSIAMWGLYNEIDSRPSTLRVVSDLQGLAKEEERYLGNLTADEEPTRRTTAATWSGFDRLGSITDTIGLNRYYGWYKALPVEVGLTNDLDALREKHPHACVGIAEYGGGSSVHQHEPWDPARFLEAPNDKNALWHSETRQAWIHEQWWKSLQPREYLCYRLIWQMFDSAADGRNEGDRPGINDKGLVTDDRKVKKDAYYFYKANWNDTNRAWGNLPTLHIVDRRWTQRPSNLVQVRAYTNLGVPTLTLNGSLLGEMMPVGTNAYVMDLTLREGDNVVEAAANHGGHQLRDRVTWSYLPKSVDSSVTLGRPPENVVETSTSSPPTSAN